MVEFKTKKSFKKDDYAMKQTVNELMCINNVRVMKLDDLQFKKIIGKGGQAEVYCAKLENEYVAAKILQDIDWKCLSNEIVILANLKHPSIPKFYGLIVDNGVIGIVTKYVDGVTLEGANVKEISENNKIFIIKSLVNVLEYMHSIKFIHRDIKPSNIMIDKYYNAYLIDFGISKVVTSPDNVERTLTRAKGSLHYLAPESLEAETYTDDNEIISYITPKVDVWSFGCIISYLFTGIKPWCNKYVDNAGTIQKVLTSKKEFPIPEEITNEKVVKLIQLATQNDCKIRPSISELKQLISDNI